MNEHLHDAGPFSAPALLTQQARGLIRWVCTKNPFYAISALLVLAGLRLSFDPQAKLFPTWSLLLVLTSYTVLLAVTASVLVRLGNVWNDVRTLLLLVVMMVVAITVFFDDIMVNDAALGLACSVGGLLFAAALSEALLHSIRLELPPWYRATYHLILVLFFLYPTAVIPFLKDPNNPALLWTLFGFSPAAGVVFLMLLPAIRRGPAYVAKNGSPWRWPLYPWVLFGLLGFCTCARAYYLCLSFHYLEEPDRYHSLSSSIFGPYFLVPHLLVGGVLLLEIGLVTRSRAALATALAVPVGLIGLTLLGHRAEPVYQTFLGMFRSELGGSPLFLTVCAAIGFYGFAVLRRVPLAADAMALSLAALAVVGPGTVTLGELLVPQPQPLLTVAAVQTWFALKRRDSRRGLSAAVCLVAACAAGLADPWTTHRGIVAWHAALASVLLIGAFGADALARLLRRGGAMMMLLSCLAVMTSGTGARWLAELPSFITHTYLVITIALTAGYGLLTSDRIYLAASAASLGSWLTVAGWNGYRYLQHFVIGLNQIFWGLVCFLLAVLISVGKASGTPSQVANGHDKASGSTDW